MALRAMQRWTNMQKLRVQLEASYLFQKHSLNRWQLVANQLASFLTASVQYSWRRLRGIDAALDLLLPGWTVTGATMTFRSVFVPLVVDIPNDLPMIHDGWIALIVAAVAEVAFIDKPLIKYRQHGTQQIGAPDKTTVNDPAKGFAAVRAAMNRRNSFSDLIEIAERVRKRLQDRGEVFDSRVATARLDSRLTHLRARSRMSDSRLSRIPTIVRELLLRRYSRYSKGLQSAVKDFLV